MAKGRLNANINDLARESVAVYLARFAAKMDTLSADYATIGKAFPGFEATPIHIKEAEAIKSLCRALVQLLMDPHYGEDEPAP